MVKRNEKGKRKMEETRNKRRQKKAIRREESTRIPYLYAIDVL